MSCHVMLHSVVICHVMSCHVMSCHVMSCHVMPRHATSCQVMSCHVMSCHGHDGEGCLCHATRMENINETVKKLQGASKYVSNSLLKAVGSTCGAVRYGVENSLRRPRLWQEFEPAGLPAGGGRGAVTLCHAVTHEEAAPPATVGDDDWIAGVTAVAINHRWVLQETAGCSWSKLEQFPPWYGGTASNAYNRFRKFHLYFPSRVVLTVR